MGQIHSTAGYAIPFFADDLHYEDITTDAFDPIVTLHDEDHVHPTEMTEPHANAYYAKNGFLVKPNADGALYCVTLRQLKDATRSNATFAEIQAALDVIEPRHIIGSENTWIECPMVKVFGGDGDGTGHYVAEAATAIQVGIIL